MITHGWYTFAQVLLAILATLFAVSLMTPWPTRLQVLVILAFAWCILYFVRLARHAIKKEAPPAKEEKK